MSGNIEIHTNAVSLDTDSSAKWVRGSDSDKNEFKGGTSHGAHISDRSSHHIADVRSLVLDLFECSGLGAGINKCNDQGHGDGCQR